MILKFQCSFIKEDFVSLNYTKFVNTDAVRTSESTSVFSILTIYTS